MTEPAERSAPRATDGSQRGGAPRGQGGPGRGPGGPPRGPAGQSGPRPAAEPFRLSEDALKTVVVEGSAEAADREARRIAGALAGGPPEAQSVVGSQLRVVLNELLRIESAWNSDDPEAARQLVLLKPKLAYSAGRNGGIARGVFLLRDFVSASIDLVAGNAGRLRNAVDFVEAVTAYYYARPGVPTGGR